MGIGVSIFLIALGAILTWAVDWSIGAIDINIIGVILMVAGAGGLTMFFYFWYRQRVPEAVTALRQQPVPRQPRTYDDTTPPATVTAVTPPKPQPGTVSTVTPQQPLPAAVTTVTATAPVNVPSQGPRQGD